MSKTIDFKKIRKHWVIGSVLGAWFLIGLVKTIVHMVLS